MSDQPFGDIPLFREIQKILAAGSGPVNLEIARQVAVAVATEGSSEPGKSAEMPPILEASLRAAEVVLAGYTRLTLVEPMRLEVVNRAEWCARTLEGWRWLFEHLAERFQSMLAGGTEGAAAGEVPAVLGQAAPLLMGMQTGTLVGSLAQEVLGRYDLPIPRQDDGRLLLVAPNLEILAKGYDLDPLAFGRFVVTNEAARHLLATSVGWLDPYARNLLSSVIDEIEIDIGGLENRLTELQSGGMEAMGSADGASLLPLVPTDGHRRALDRVTSLVALIDGYSNHAVDVVTETTPDTTRMKEGIARRRASPSAGTAALQTLLGLTLDRPLEQAGKTFCAAVVQLRGIASLNRLWEAPDNLPTAEEVKDPFQWMERVLDD